MHVNKVEQSGVFQGTSGKVYLSLKKASVDTEYTYNSAINVATEAKSDL